MIGDQTRDEHATMTVIFVVTESFVVGKLK